MDPADLRTSAPLLGEPLPVELMNTIWADRDGVHDALSGSEALAAWLAAVGDRRGDARPTPELVDGFRRLRDALRELAAIATDDDRRPSSAPPDLDQALAAVNDACAQAPSWSRLSWSEGGEPVRETRSAGPPPEVALAAIAEQAVELFAGPARTQLRACHAPKCVLYFLRDHPRREWCSAGCGNRARVARHYQRHRAVAGPSAAD
jgi:predicted RNA-binding Zn ribbon-like protein